MNLFRKKKGFQFAAFLSVLGIMAGSLLPVRAEEENAEEIVSYIYHQHIGSSTEEGGCYRQPVYHSHTGDETAGGSCYETPVYHSHAGNETDGGSCYENVVYHVHEGDGMEEIGCYVADYHTHSSGCYKKVDDDEYGCYVVDWWDTSEDDYEGHDYKWFEMSCGQTIHGTNSSHYHNELNCSRGSDVTGFILGCDKTEESIECYSLSCDKTEEFVDGYTLSCTKTLQEIDGYERSCGKEEDVPCGVLVITRQELEAEGAMAFVQVKDMTEGELQFSETPFLWYDKQGSLIGTGDSISVSENGIYQVKADIVNEDINEESLWSEVTVDNIRKPEPEEDEDDDEENSEEETEPEQTEEEPVVTPVSTPAATATPSPTVAPTSIEEAKNTPDNGGQIPSDDSMITGETDGQAAYRTERVDKEKKSTPTPYLKKESQTVKIEEKKSSVEPVATPKTIQKEHFFSSPATQVLVLTSGMLVALISLFLIFYLFRRSVKIYNDDGQGNMTYLGRSMVQLTDAGYLIVITEQMTEKALTNRYGIRPGMFAAGRKEEELLVEKQDKRISVPLQKEIIVVI